MQATGDGVDGAGAAAGAGAGLARRLAMPALAVIALGAFFARRLHRLPERPAGATRAGWIMSDASDGRSLPTGASRAARRAALLLALAAAMFVLQQIGISTAMALAARLAPAPTEMAAAARTQGLGAIGLVVAQLPVLAAAALLVSRPGARRGREALLGLLAMAAAWPVVATTAMVAIALRARFIGEPTDPIGHEVLRLILDDGSGAWRLALIGYAVIGAPVVEEVLYRGLLQQAGRAIGLSPWSAIAATSALFAAAHWSVVAPPALAALVVLGLLFGWLRERTGGLTSPIVAHAAFNVANLVIATA